MGEKVMAGDWLKFDKATPDKPEVFAIASTLDIDPDAVVGKLMRVWSWFDTHTENGNAPSVTSALLDRIAGVTGFVTAMQKCGWIELSESGVLLPNFNRHCGETAKKRAQNNNRVSKLRTRNAENVTPALQKHVPEKRREEKNIKAKSKAKNGRSAPVVLPSTISPDVWAMWDRYRNSKKGWTADAKLLSLRTLTTLAAKGHDPRLIVEASIERGWTGLFEPKDASYASSPQKALGLADQVMRNFEHKQRRLGHERND
jgi:hypothetical protein